MFILIFILIAITLVNPPLQIIIDWHIAMHNKKQLKEKNFSAFFFQHFFLAFSPMSTSYPSLIYKKEYDKNNNKIYYLNAVIIAFYLLKITRVMIFILIIVKYP